MEKNYTRVTSFILSFNFSLLHINFCNRYFKVVSKLFPLSWNENWKYSFYYDENKRTNT